MSNKVKPTAVNGTVWYRVSLGQFVDGQMVVTNIGADGRPNDRPQLLKSAEVASAISAYLASTPSFKGQLRVMAVRA